MNTKYEFKKIDVSNIDNLDDIIDAQNYLAGSTNQI